MPTICTKTSDYEGAAGRRFEGLGLTECYNRKLRKQGQEGASACYVCTLAYIRKYGGRILLASMDVGAKGGHLTLS